MKTTMGGEKPPPSGNDDVGNAAERGDMREKMDGRSERSSPALSLSLSHLETLPDDILLNIFNRLEVPDLMAHEPLSRTLQRRVHDLGIPSYLRRNPYYHVTLSPAASTWPPHQLLRYQHTVERSLRNRRYQALQVGPTWPQAVIPCLSVSPERVVYGVGGKLIVHPLQAPPEPCTNGHAIDGSASSRDNGYDGFVKSSGDRPCGGRSRYAGKSVCRGEEYTIAKPRTGSRADIVGLAEVGNGELAVAQFDGTLQRFNGSMRSVAHYPHPQGSNVHTFSASASRNLMMTTTSTGMVSVFHTRSPWLPPDTFDMGCPRAWSSCIPDSYSTDAALVGVSGSINVHPLVPSGPLHTPSRALVGPELPRKSSPYDIVPAPPDSAQSPSVLLSAWYDSHLRLHDLRLPSPSPVVALSDPWTWADGSAMYSAAFVASHHVAGGGARHGVVALFDVRQPSGGWSVFSPGGKGSPVYQLAGEGGRVWGVTEARGFLLALDGSGDRREGMVRDDARAEAPALAPAPALGGVEHGQGQGQGHGHGHGHGYGYGYGQVQGGRGGHAHNKRARERVSGWKGRGGKWGWTVRYGEDESEGVVGYEHGRRFESLAGGVMGSGAVQLLESVRVV